MTAIRLATSAWLSGGSADILNTVDRGTEKHIMETLEIEEPELADEIRKKMFVFEDILLLDDKAIQRVLRDVDNNDLAVALKGANEQVQNAIFNDLVTSASGNDDLTGILQLTDNIDNLLLCFFYTFHIGGEGNPPR